MDGRFGGASTELHNMWTTWWTDPFRFAATGTYDPTRSCILPIEDQ